MKDIYLSNKNLTKLPKDLPQEIDGNFNCGNNKLITLEGSPQKVGAPKEVGGGFSCPKNKLTILEIVKGLWNSKIKGIISLILILILKSFLS
jgi:hypothetical protein